LTRAFAVLVALLAAAPLAAAEIALSSVWMRPVQAGAKSARAYVDIRSDADLTLVGATTPLAKRVVLVHVKTLDDPASERAVKSFPVTAGTPTRLAYRGDHLRLMDIRRDAVNGEEVPLTLSFTDAKGKRVEAATRIVVRGLMPEPAPDLPRNAPKR
jgi:hypothetical protein